MGAPAPGSAAEGGSGHTRLFHRRSDDGPRLAPILFLLLRAHSTNTGENMPQLHLYVPDAVAEAAKAKARAAGKSLSSYLADLVTSDVAGDWPEDFFDEVVGGWKGAPLERPKQGRPERRRQF